jgi:hypothetical protein
MGGFKRSFQGLSNDMQGLGMKIVLMLLFSLQSEKEHFFMWAMTKQYLHTHSTWLESAICLES